jgi:hypothetical protein
MTKQHPTQSRMFATNDLPLFSMTAPRAHDSIFTPAEPEPEQLTLVCTHPTNRIMDASYTHMMTGEDVIQFRCLDCREYFTREQVINLLAQRK